MRGLPGCCEREINGSRTVIRQYDCHLCSCKIGTLEPELADKHHRSTTDRDSRDLAYMARTDQ